MSTPSFPARRRAFAPQALSAGVAVLLAACGGGGGGAESPAPEPQIAEFSADCSSYRAGESAQLVARFSNGSGRIEPQIGAVDSGTTRATAPLQQATRYRLVVTSGNRSVSRDLDLPVGSASRLCTIATLRATEHQTVGVDAQTAWVIGGSRAESNIPSSAIDAIDTRTRAVQRIGELKYGRLRHATVALPERRWLVVGGITALNLARPPAEILSVGADGRAVATLTGSLVWNRIGHTATALADGRVLVTGGETGERGALGISDSAEIWSPATGTFRQVAARMAMARQSHSATLLADGRVLIVGGFTGAATYIAAEIFDPQTETFAVVDAAIPPRALHGALRLPDGDVLVLGGEDPAFGRALDSVLRFDTQRGVWQEAGRLTARRSVVTAAGTTDGAALLFGGALGANESLQALDTTERVAATGEATPLPRLREARSWHTVTALAGGSALIVGGQTAGRNYAAAVELFD